MVGPGRHTDMDTINVSQAMQAYLRRKALFMGDRTWGVQLSLWIRLSVVTGRASVMKLKAYTHYLRNSLLMSLISISVRRA